MAAERYYVKNQTTGELEWLEPPIDIGGGQMRIHASPAQWAAHQAYKRNDSAPVPAPPEGKIARPTGWEVQNGAWVRSYEFVDAPPPVMNDYDEAMEAHLRSEREARGYTTREPDSYLTSQVPRWAQDAQDWVAHRDAVMGYALALINAVESGQREPPTVKEFVAGLPSIVWTYAEE